MWIFLDVPFFSKTMSTLWVLWHYPVCITMCKTGTGWEVCRNTRKQLKPLYVFSVWWTLLCFDIYILSSTNSLPIRTLLFILPSVQKFCKLFLFFSWWITCLHFFAIITFCFQSMDHVLFTFFPLWTLCFVATLSATCFDFGCVHIHIV